MPPPSGFIVVPFSAFFFAHFMQLLYPSFTLCKNTVPYLYTLLPLRTNKGAGVPGLVTIFFSFFPHTLFSKVDGDTFIDGETCGLYSYLRARALPGPALALATKCTLQWYTGIWLFRPAGGLKLETQRSSSRHRGHHVLHQPEVRPFLPKEGCSTRLAVSALSTLG